MSHPSPQPRSAHDVGHPAANGAGPGQRTDRPAPARALARDTEALAPVEDDVVDLAGLRPLVARRTLAVVTERRFDVVDVTASAARLVADTGLHQGTITVFSRHTTCAVKINEHETCFLEDLRLFMEALVAPEAYYHHDDFEIRDHATLAGALEDEPINGHSHIKQMLLGAASETVPVVDGDLALGRWQRVMFIELDQARPRRIHLQADGWA